MKKQKETAPDIKSSSTASEEQMNDEALTQTDNQSGKKQPADRTVMATHGFLRILSTTRRR